MPTGCYIHRTAETNFKPQQSQKYGQTALEWISPSLDVFFLLNMNLMGMSRGSAIVTLPLTDGVQTLELYTDFIVFSSRLPMQRETHQFRQEEVDSDLVFIKENILLQCHITMTTFFITHYLHHLS